MIVRKAMAKRVQPDKVMPASLYQPRCQRTREDTRAEREPTVRDRQRSLCYEKA